MAEKTNSEKKKTVLLVDDSEKDLELFGYALRRSGYEVKTASSGEEALGILRSENNSAKSIDVVVLDILLPGIDGIRVLKEIKEKINFCLPVIMHSAYDYRDDFAVCPSEAYVMKSHDFSELAKTVKSLLSPIPQNLYK